jgi:hypothetical protein
LAEPKPASANLSASRIFFRPEAASPSASSQLASRNTADQLPGSTLKSADFFTPGLRIKGFVSRCGWLA